MFVKYNGSAWSELGGLNGLKANDVVWAVCSDASGNIYAAGQFTNTSGKWYVAKYGLTTGLNNTAAWPLQIIFFPNPASNSTTVSFSLSKSQKVSLKILDVNGRLVSTLTNNVFKTGEHQIVFNVEKLVAGIYFLKMQAGEFLKTEKLVVTK